MKNRRLAIVTFMLVAILLLGVGYAAVSRQLQISGTAHISAVTLSEFDVTFTDSSTNLQGGWLKTGTFEYYGFNSVYQIYQTEHTGLGKNKWIITKK
jgi:hypothetical protein